MRILDAGALEDLRGRGWARIRAPRATGRARRAAPAWEEFFASEDKYKFRHLPGKLDGYFAQGSETALGYAKPDPKEFFHVYPPTVLPPKLSDHSVPLLRSATELAQNIAEDLFSSGILPFAVSLASGGSQLLRVAHYSESGVEPLAQLHTDITLFTLLVFETGPGLQLIDHGKRVDVSPSKSEALLIAGDLLEIATSGTIRAVPHMVRRSTGDRLSFVFFANPGHDTLLAPGLTAGRVLEERLKAMGGYA
jgi:isopenicillin N synthase-like dioxygenase